MSETAGMGHGILGVGRCDVDMKPETNYTNLEPEPVNNQFISDIFKQMELEYRNSKVFKHHTSDTVQV